MSGARPDLGWRSTVIALPRASALEVDRGILLTMTLGMLVCMLAATRPISPFDGGVSASAGTFIRQGLLPYRDFWLLYGPLSAVIVAAALSFAPPTMLLLRTLGAISIVGQLLPGYLLARRFAPDGAARVLAIAAVALPTMIIGLEFSAWSLAMALALSALALGTSKTRHAALGAGVLVGLAAIARADVGLYSLIALLVATRSRAVLVGALAVVAPVGLVLFATVPMSALVEQLVWYPILGQREFRAVAWPGYGAGEEAAALLFVPLVMLPRLAIALAFLNVLRWRPGGALTGLAIFALLCQLQTTSRGDIVHFAQVSTPALLLFARWIPRSANAAGRRAIVTGAVVAPSMAMALLLGAYGARGSGSDIVDAAAFAAHSTVRGEAIFVGLTANRHTFNNPLLVYYLADRPTAVRHDTYNPGVTTREDVQHGMVADLESSSTRVLVLDAGFARAFEPDNRSREPGATVLDDYLAATFAPLQRFGDYVVYVRREANS